MCSCQQRWRAAAACIRARTSARTSRTRARTRALRASPSCPRLDLRSCTTRTLAAPSAARPTMSARTPSSIARHRARLVKRGPGQVVAARNRSIALAARCPRQSCDRRRRPRLPTWRHLELELRDLAAFRAWAVRSVAFTRGYSARWCSARTWARAPIGNRCRNRVVRLAAKAKKCARGSRQSWSASESRSWGQFGSQSTVLTQQQGGIPVFSRPNPCRRDLSRCPERALQCAQCPHRPAGHWEIRSLGLLTTRIRTRRRRQALEGLHSPSLSQERRPFLFRLVCLSILAWLLVVSLVYVIVR